MLYSTDSSAISPASDINTPITAPIPPIRCNQIGIVAIRMEPCSPSRDSRSAISVITACNSCWAQVLTGLFSPVSTDELSSLIFGSFCKDGAWLCQYNNWSFAVRNRLDKRSPSNQFTSVGTDSSLRHEDCNPLEKSSCSLTLAM